jgi:hypothetical protein
MLIHSIYSLMAALLFVAVVAFTWVSSTEEDE